MANQHPAFRKNAVADWLRWVESWRHLVQCGGASISKVARKLGGRSIGHCAASIIAHYHASNIMAIFKIVNESSIEFSHCDILLVPLTARVGRTMLRVAPTQLLTSALSENAGRGKKSQINNLAMEDGVLKLHSPMAFEFWPHFLR